jgi:hypothetical protein
MWKEKKKEAAEKKKRRIKKTNILQTHIVFSKITP